MKEDIIKIAGQRLKDIYGANPKERITIYVVTNSTATSNLSGKYSAYVIKDNKPVCLTYNCKVRGCGLDRTFELAYNIFCSVYGYNGKIRYQDYLKKENLN